MEYGAIASGHGRNCNDTTESVGLRTKAINAPMDLPRDDWGYRTPVGNEYFDEDESEGIDSEGEEVE